MVVFNGSQELEAEFKGAAVVIGNFDGLHLGHRELIREARKAAAELKIPVVIYTFDPHPIKILKPDPGVKKMFNTSDLVREAERIGVNAIVIEPFDQNFSEISAQSFLQNILWDRLKPSLVILGENFRFGHKRSGNAEELKNFFKLKGAKAIILSSKCMDNVPISSSRIRELIAIGDVSFAQKLLGRSYYLLGHVVRGDGRGRKIGFKTANIKTDAEIIPANGVYATWCLIKNQKFPSVTNIGVRPTFSNSSEVVIETHLIGQDVDVYESHVQLFFEAKIREEIKFSSPEKLSEQIQKDIVATFKVLGKV